MAIAEITEIEKRKNRDDVIGMWSTLSKQKTKISSSLKIRLALTRATPSEFIHV